MNNKILIATAMYNGDFFKDKEILSLDKSAQTQVKTTNQVQVPTFDFELLYENKPVFYSIIAVVLIVFVIVLKLIFGRKKNNQTVKNKSVETVKSLNNSAVSLDKKEQKIGMNFATPSNLNACVRMFLERTKHK